MFKKLLLILLFGSFFTNSALAAEKKEITGPLDPRLDAELSKLYTKQLGKKVTLKLATSEDTASVNIKNGNCGDYKQSVYLALYIQSKDLKEDSILEIIGNRIMRATAKKAKQLKCPYVKE